uniref:Synuclein gamma n=1 Tax=Equus caballus TaxID=9796 RepID=A0A3Q2LIG3_HORSE
QDPTSLRIPLTTSQTPRHGQQRLAGPETASGGGGPGSRAPGKAHSCPPRLKCYQEASVYRTLPLGLTFPILTAAGAAVQQVVDQATEAGQKAMDQAAKSTQETIDKTANQASETFSGFGKKLGLLK